MSRYCLKYGYRLHPVSDTLTLHTDSLHTLSTYPLYRLSTYIFILILSLSLFVSLFSILLMFLERTFQCAASKNMFFCCKKHNREYIPTKKDKNCIHLYTCPLFVLRYTFGESETWAPECKRFLTLRSRRLHTIQTPIGNCQKLRY